MNHAWPINVTHLLSPQWWVWLQACVSIGFPCGSACKESARNVEDLGLVPELGRTPGEGKGYPLQYSGLENSMDYIVHGAAKSRTRLSDFHFHMCEDASSVAPNPFVVPRTIAHQAPLPFPSPGELPDPETEPDWVSSLVSPAPAGGFLTTAPPEKPLWTSWWCKWLVRLKCVLCWNC